MVNNSNHCHIQCTFIWQVPHFAGSSFRRYFIFENSLHLKWFKISRDMMKAKSSLGMAPMDPPLVANNLVIVDATSLFCK